MNDSEDQNEKQKRNTSIGLNKVSLHLRKQPSVLIPVIGSCSGQHSFYPRIIWFISVQRFVNI